MTSGPERLDSSYAESPYYGLWGQHLGLAAWRALDYLSRELDAPDSALVSRAWLDTDFAALNSTVDVAARADTPSRIKPRLEARDDRTLTTHLKGLYLALPFSEAERYELVSGYNDMKGYLFSRDDDPHFAETIARQKLELLSGGMPYVIPGQDVLDRWWDWRHEVSAFDRGFGIQEAHIALTGIVELMTPRLPMPYWYKRFYSDIDDGKTDADEPSPPPLLDHETYHRID